MSNCKMTDKFFDKVEKAGLDQAFGKMTSIASDTLGCYLEDIIDDFAAQKEKPLARICYQEKYMLGSTEYEAYVVMIDPLHNNEWGQDSAFFIKDGELMSWQIVAKIRDLMRMGYEISFA